MTGPIRLDRPEDAPTVLRDWLSARKPTGDPKAPIPTLAVDCFCPTCGGRTSHWQGCPGGDAA